MKQSTFGQFQKPLQPRSLPSLSDLQPEEKQDEGWGEWGWVNQSSLPSGVTKAAVNNKYRVDFLAGHPEKVRIQRFDSGVIHSLITLHRVQRELIGEGYAVMMKSVEPQMVIELLLYKI